MTFWMQDNHFWRAAQAVSAHEARGTYLRRSEGASCRAPRCAYGEEQEGDAAVPGTSRVRLWPGPANDRDENRSSRWGDHGRSFAINERKHVTAQSPLNLVVGGRPQQGVRS